jgi:hypothetical protein
MRFLFLNLILAPILATVHGPSHIVISTNVVVTIQVKELTLSKPSRVVEEPTAFLCPTEVFNNS